MQSFSPLQSSWAKFCFHKKILPGNYQYVLLLLMLCSGLYGRSGLFILDGWQAIHFICYWICLIMTACRLKGSCNWAWRSTDGTSPAYWKRIVRYPATSLEWRLDCSIICLRITCCPHHVSTPTRIFIWQQVICTPKRLASAVIFVHTCQYVGAWFERPPKIVLVVIITGMTQRAGRVQPEPALLPQSSKVVLWERLFKLDLLVVCTTSVETRELILSPRNAGMSLTHQSSATHIPFNGTSAGEGSPILLSTAKEYPGHMGNEAQVLHHPSQEDIGGAAMLDPTFQVEGKSWYSRAHICLRLGASTSVRLLL